MIDALPISAISYGAQALGLLEFDDVPNSPDLIRSPHLVEVVPSGSSDGEIAQAATPRPVADEASSINAGSMSSGTTGADHIPAPASTPDDNEIAEHDTVTPESQNVGQDASNTTS
jgi:hypothetical protein